MLFSKKIQQHETLCSQCNERVDCIIRPRGDCVSLRFFLAALHESWVWAIIGTIQLPIPVIGFYQGDFFTGIIWTIVCIADFGLARQARRRADEIIERRLKLNEFRDASREVTGCQTI